MKTNKILLCLVAILFLVAFVPIDSALDFDNSLTYENEDRTAVITNAFGLGELLGKAELKSHSTPTEIINIIRGQDRLTMYYDFKNWKKYENGLGEVYFTNMYSGEELG